MEVRKYKTEDLGYAPGGIAYEPIASKDPDVLCEHQTRPPLVAMRTVCPMLYRFLEEKWVDKFLEEGELMLSTFKRCTKLPGPRKDELELFNTVAIIDGDRTMEVCNRGRLENFVLCGSMSPDAWHDPRQDTFLKIEDLNGLIIEILKAMRRQDIPVLSVLQGPCIYTGGSIVRHYPKHLKIVDDVLRQLQRADHEIDEASIGRLLGDTIGDWVYFTKEACYSKEMEYRVVFVHGDAKARDSLILKIENPRMYCSKGKVPLT